MLDDLSSTLALRLRDLARMLDRLDRLESGTGEWLTSQGDAALKEAAREMMLRALRVAADPINFAILNHLAAHSSAPMADLETAIELGRLALSERVSDLVQVGLAGRNIDIDHVQATPAGAALAAWINGIGETTAKKLAEALQPIAQ
jgi:hypothetical protein